MFGHYLSFNLVLNLSQCSTSLLVNTNKLALHLQFRSTWRKRVDFGDYLFGIEADNNPGDGRVLWSLHHDRAGELYNVLLIALECERNWVGGKCLEIFIVFVDLHAPKHTKLIGNMPQIVLYYPIQFITTNSDGVSEKITSVVLVKFKNRISSIS